MKIFLSIISFIKTHIIISLITCAVVISGVTTILVFNNANSNKKNEFKTLNDGKYSCEIMYNGKSLNNDSILSEYKKEFEKYDSSLKTINLEDFKNGLNTTFGTSYIEKKNDTVSLYISIDGKTYKYFIYDIKNKKFSLNKDLSSEDDEEAFNNIEIILNDLVTIEETKDSFTYKNYGSILLYPTLYNNKVLNGESRDFEYKYSFPGDLVCGKEILNNESIAKKDNETNESNSESIDETNEPNIEKNDETNELSSEKTLYNQYAGKYVGTGSETASESYIELLSDGTAKVNINYCGGWSLYKGKYYFTTAEYTGETEIYINQLSIYNGETISVPEALFFSVDGNKLFTQIGYLGTNNFDCGVSTDFIKQ